MVQEVIRLTNVERAKYNLAPLQYHAGLQQAAMVRAKEISIKLAHTRPDGTLYTTAISEAGVGCPDLENITAGYHTPKAVMDAWMNSPGHKAAIISKSATHIGVGFYKASNGVYYWVQDYSTNPDKKYTVTCNTNGGTFDDGSTSKAFTFPAEMHITFAKDLPIPTRDGYTFAGWSSYGRIYTGIGLGSNLKLTAEWTAN